MGLARGLTPILAFPHKGGRDLFPDCIGISEECVQFAKFLFGFD